VDSDPPAARRRSQAGSAEVPANRRDHSRLGDVDRNAFPGVSLPEGLSTLPIDTNLDRGEYWDPNVWLVHRVSA